MELKPNENKNTENSMENIELDFKLEDELRKVQTLAEMVRLLKGHKAEIVACRAAPMKTHSYDTKPVRPLQYKQLKFW